MNTEVERKQERQYIVTDYASTLGVFDKLKDARECMKKRGEGFQCAIESVTTETLVITTREYIQHLR